MCSAVPMVGMADCSKTLVKCGGFDSAALWRFGMFWTAFIWGLAATLGGSFGLMSFVILFDLWRKVAKIKEIKRANELAELANTALMRRNELTEKQIGALAAMAVSLSTIADSSEEMVDSQ